jgi:hypothetical protein
MESGTGYIVCNAICDICTHKWTAVVEVDTLRLLSETEYKKPSKLECPNCGRFTSSFDVVEFR